MYKKLFGGIAIVAIAVLTAWNVNVNLNFRISDVSLANLEALSKAEDNLCPGCNPKGDGCFCSIWYQTCQEKPWNK